MDYTVTKLAELSGVSVRTLHWYDEIGLLKPAYYGSNGYRYYEEKQLLILQQILFFRELGFELKKIQKLLGRSDFDQVLALRSHRKALTKDLETTKKLIKTIDKTLEHLLGDKKMKGSEFYEGFDIKKQAQYEQELINRFGDKIKDTFDECRQNTKDWKKTDWDINAKEFESICLDLSKLIESNFKTDSVEVQKIVKRHFNFLKKFWTPNKETYSGHGYLILESELGNAYKAYHPKLPEFICKAIQVYANNELE